MKIWIKTYGCQMNDRDTEGVLSLLISHGHELAEGETDADVIIVNTCSVREKAEDKALGKLGLLVAGKREFPGRVVGAMGCMAQRLGVSIFEKVKGLDFAVGTHRLAHVPGIVDAVSEGSGAILDVDFDDDRRDGLSGHEEGKVSAFVNILFGCDRRCTYCVVPAVRGSEWSRPGEGIVEEVREMAKKGARDVTLLGQSVMSYGRRNSVWPGDYESPGGFKEPLSRLLEAVGAVSGIERVRFTSGHPSGCTEELAGAMGKIPEVCEHLHLPMQSACDRILGMMKRGYDSDGYRSAVKRLRSVLPGMALTTDIIVGFPSETEKEFEETREFMDEIGFDNAFIFKYSPRPGTGALKWDDDVAGEEKLRRNKVLLADQDKRGLVINGRLVGRVQEVLAEGPSLRNPARWSGRTRTNKIVVFDPVPAVKPGDLVNVRIDRAGAQTVYGVRELAPALGRAAC